MQTFSFQTGANAVQISIKHSRKNLTNVFLERCVNYRIINSGKIRKLHGKIRQNAHDIFSSYALVFCGPQTRFGYDKEEERVFQKRPFTTFKFVYPRCYSIPKYGKIHGVNKQQNIAYFARLEEMERKLISK